MRDFWRSSGWHLLERRQGRLVVTDDLIRAYLKRPEMRPPEDAGPAERALHAALLDGPRQAVERARLAGVEDPDARENFAVFLSFRDRLVRHGSLEEAYLSLFREGRVAVPPLFIDQMAHMIVREVLEGTGDALRARAAELFFRPQNVSTENGSIMLADSETVEMYASTGGFGDLGRLLVEAQTPLRTIELDVLDETNGERYWSRDERHDTVLDLTFARPGLDALCRVLEAWIAHFFRTKVRIQPVQKITDERWVWHIGLDAEATLLLNDLYNGVEVGEDRLVRLLSLFRLDFEDSRDMRADIAGRPVYLALAMNEKKVLRLKPQNLLVNLPLATTS